jgi:hypothetical protein
MLTGIQSSRTDAVEMKPIFLNFSPSTTKTPPAVTSAM